MVSYCVMPHIIHGKAEIAKVFKVSLKTIVEWHKRGAPIATEGGRYSVEINALQHWLVVNSRG